MKKILAMILVLCALIALSACQKSSDSVSTDATTPQQTEDTTIETLPEVSLLINDNADDCVNHIAIFPGYWERDAFTLGHYYVTSNNPEETIRIRIEYQVGSNDKIEGNYEVYSDDLVTVKTNEWNTFVLPDGSNVYFCRATIYFGESETVLATRTVYTPYEKAYYSKKDFSDTAPEFHVCGLNEEEQRIFEQCRYAVVDHAKRNGYSGVLSMVGWRSNSHVYIDVEFSSASGAKYMKFAISNNDYTNFRESSSWDLIPSGVGTSDNAILEEYYYVEVALTNAIAT